MSRRHTFTVPCVSPIRCILVYRIKRWLCFAALAQIYVIVSIGAVVINAVLLPHMMFCLPLLLYIFKAIQRRYLHTSREVTRLMNMAKTPVYTHFSSSLDGLACIRAARLQGQFEARFQEFLDTQNRPYLRPPLIHFADRVLVGPDPIHLRWGVPYVLTDAF